MKAYKTKATCKNLQNTKHKTQAKIIAYFKRPLPLIPISFVFILFLLLLGSCETNEIVVKSVIPKDFKVNNISSEKLNEKLNRTKNKSDLRRFMVSSKNNLQQSKITSESGIVIETDNIKEITQGYYASYTMLLKIPNTNSQTFYNITIEVKNNTSTFFITGYFPSENWKENPSQKYEGQITTFRILGSGGGSSSNILQEYVEDIIQDNDLLSGQYGFGNTPGLGGPSSSYPWDCDGEVVTTYVIQPVMCSQNVHWPWSTGPCSASLKAYYDFITTYACLQSPFNNDPIEGSPHDGNYSGVGGNNNGSANNPAASLTTIIVPIKTEKEIKQIFQAGLSPNQLAWWNNPVNESSVASIIEYLTQNQTFDVESDNPFDFMNQCIDQMMQNPTLFTSINPLLIEKNIDDSQLDPCGADVFQQVKNSTNCDFANVLAKLDANGSVYNTTIKTEHNYYTDSNGIVHEVPTPGNTVHNSPYNYTVYINPDYPGKTKLFIAALQLHELAHAYFFSLLDDYNSGATNSFNELPIIYNAFVVNKQNFNPNLTHEEIANSYVVAISAALQEYQPGLDQQVYDDMAWGGLIGTPIFDTLFPAGNPNLARITNRYTSEQTGNPQGQGTANQQNPLGQPCN